MTVLVSRSQAGVTLIGLMVGLLISMIGVLAIFSGYKTLISSTVQSNAETNYDGGIERVLLRAQLEAQGAGYGLPAGAHYAVTATSLMWRDQQPDGIVRCYQIADLPSVTAETNLPARNLDYFMVDSTTPANQCTQTTDLATAVVWGDALETLGQFTPGIIVDLIGAALIPPVFNFTFDEDALCSPYGVSRTPVEHPQVTISAPRSVEQNTANDLPDAQISICLSNI